ncbi:hypothetical protein GCM10025791_47450 [Halioxenophilus aromaticivorans]|uniref:TonB-dependent receptor n=2 Tax=Halioxenophilus aromaticivorans TaxID=1306992 RepID=A0AAV3U970_9ALTE
MAAASPTVASPEESLANLYELSLEELTSIEVFKSANLLPENSATAPGTVYSFTGKDFERFGVRSLDGLLQFVPGFQINQYRKRHQSVWARGAVQRYNDKFVLLVDGVRRQHLYYGHFSGGEALPLENVEKVEIILGPASSLYGANAFSGLISVTTKGLSENPTASISAELGNFSRQKVTGSYANQHVQVFASYLDQNAPFSKDRVSFIGSEVVQPTDEEYKELSFKVGLAPGLTWLGEYRKSSTPFLFIPSTQDALVDTEFYSTSLNFQAGSVEQGQIDFSLFYQNDKALEYEIERTTRRIGLQERQNANMAGAKLVGLKQFGEHTLAMGSAWRLESAEEMDFYRTYRFNEGFLSQPEQGSLLAKPNIRTQDYATFLQDVWQWNDELKVTLGLRYDLFDDFENHFNYRAAAVYSPNDQQNWKLLYGTANRQPTFREYLKVLEATTFTPPSLRAEKIRSLELSHHYANKRFSSSITAYRNVLRHYIREEPTPDGADEYFTNVDGEITFHGVDTVLTYQLNKRINVRASLAYIDVNSSEQNTDDTLYWSPWSGSLNADFQLSANHHLGFSLLFIDNRSDANSYEDEAKAFTLFNIHYRGQLTDNIRYKLGVDNLFNDQIMDTAADYGSYYNSEKSRRQLWLNVTWTPK